MHNIELILRNFDSFLQNMHFRGKSKIDLIELQTLPSISQLRKESITFCQKIEQDVNQINSKIIPPLKKQEKIYQDSCQSEELEKIQIEILKNIQLVSDSQTKIKEFQEIIDQCDQKIKQILDKCPNCALGNQNDSLDSIIIPIGKEENNKEIFAFGQPKQFDFNPLSHEEIGKNLQAMDFEQTAKISGSRFVTLSGKIALLEKALINFMLDVHIKEHGYELFSPPYLVRNKAMYGVGQLPKFSEESFISCSGPEEFNLSRTIQSDETYRLIPTAEVCLTNLVREKILLNDQLPLRMVACTPCFRSEIGSGGRDTSGIIRLHQFMKVELVSITDNSQIKKVIDSNYIDNLNKDINDIESELDRMTRAACKILELLQLPYRIVLLASQDMGFGARKTYDIEVWMPSQNRYREISSCSYCDDFQARRMNARYKNSLDNKNYFLHTFNGSALAVGRAIAAIIENYQDSNGDFEIPLVLTKYL